MSEKDRSVFNIRDFGARTNDCLQTRMIQDTIDACFQSGGGIVEIPAGVFTVGSLRLRSGVSLLLRSGAILRGSLNPEDYFSYQNDVVEPLDVSGGKGIVGSVFPFSRWNNAIIRVINAVNISIIGETGSYIDGRNCFDPMGEEKFRGPHCIDIQNSENIHLVGYTIIDSANWAHAIFRSRNIDVSNIHVFGGHDGFDIRSCDNVHLKNCEFHTGDDSIAGFDNQDCIFENCILDSSCSAFRFGGNNILIENCSAKAPSSYSHRWTLSDEKKIRRADTGDAQRHNMLNFFLYYCDFRADIRKAPGSIIVRNCNIEGADHLFQICFDGEHRWCSNRSLNSIQFENCEVKDVKYPILVYGDEKEPITFSMNHVSLSYSKEVNENPVADMYNFKKMSFKNVYASRNSNPKVICRNEGIVEIEDSNIEAEFCSEKPTWNDIGIQ